MAGKNFCGKQLASSEKTKLKLDISSILLYINNQIQRRMPEMNQYPADVVKRIREAESLLNASGQFEFPVLVDADASPTDHHHFAPHDVLELNHHRYF